jgi:hypothetical protein
LLQLRIGIEVPEGTPTYYANWIEVSHTKWDFCITAAAMPSRHNPSKMAEVMASKVLNLNAEVQIVISPTVLPALIRALTAQKEAFEQETKTELKEVGQ